MQQNYTAVRLAEQTTFLRGLFDRVLLLDAVTGAVLDPVTLDQTGPAPLPLPALDEQGRAWEPVCEDQNFENVTLYCYQAVTVEGRACLLAVGRVLEAPPSYDRRETEAFHRQIRRHQEELRRDYVTGVYNRRYLLEEYRPRATALAAAGKPLAMALVRVNEYKALCADEGAEAADGCLNTAAGILGTAIDPAWEASVLARCEDGIFMVAAAVEAEVLRTALDTALTGSRKQFNLSLSRRGHFTTALVVASWAEAGSWDALLKLGVQRMMQIEI